jgi:omega-6 fatty acid desaturase / acyl-lipid omega-6 desaturase (Delta-12 desaturase)
MTQDQVYVPATRLDYNLRALDPAEDDFQGANVSIKVRQELWEALGDSPVSASLECAIYLVRPLDRVDSPLKFSSLIFSSRSF